MKFLFCYRETLPIDSQCSIDLSLAFFRSCRLSDPIYGSIPGWEDNGCEAMCPHNSAYRFPISSISLFLQQATDVAHQLVGQNCYENMAVNAIFLLMSVGAQPQISFQGLETILGTR